VVPSIGSTPQAPDRLRPERIIDVVIENVEYCPVYIQIRVVVIPGAFELRINFCLRSTLDGGLGVICG
jgi:hypothetical protein